LNANEAPSQIVRLIVLVLIGKTVNVSVIVLSQPLLVFSV
jgi:hypothetical protein